MAIVRLDKVQSAYNGNIVSIKHTSDIDNGSLWVLGNLQSGEREVFSISAVTATYASSNLDGLDPIVLHASAEYDYNPTKAGLKDFKLMAGEVGRAYFLVPGDIITVTSDLFSTAPTSVGNLVIPDPNNAGKYVYDADGNLSVTDGTNTRTVKSKLIFKYIEATTLGYDQTTAYTLLVVQNCIR